MDYEQASEYLRQLLDERSEIAAVSVLERVVEKLREGAAGMPDYLQPILADAIQRVLDEGEAVRFLCGPKGSKEGADVNLVQEIYVLVESRRRALGRLNTSRKGDGAYDRVADEMTKVGRHWSPPQVEKYHKRGQALLKNSPAFAQRVAVMLEALAPKR